MVAPAPSLSRLIRTSGVLPTRAVTSSWMGTRDRLRGARVNGVAVRSNQQTVMCVPRTGYVALRGPTTLARTRRRRQPSPGLPTQTGRLLLSKLPSMPALQIVALLLCLAVTAVAVALFAKVVGHFVAVFRLGQADPTRTGQPATRTRTLVREFL